MLFKGYLLHLQVEGVVVVDELVGERVPLAEPLLHLVERRAHALLSVLLHVRQALAQRRVLRRLRVRSALSNDS